MFILKILRPMPWMLPFSSILLLSLLGLVISFLLYLRFYALQGTEGVSLLRFRLEKGIGGSVTS